MQNPFLFDLEISLLQEKKNIDELYSLLENSFTAFDVERMMSLSNELNKSIERYNTISNLISKEVE